MPIRPSRGDPLRWPRNTLYPQKLALTSPTSDGRSVGIVRLRTKATEFICINMYCGNFPQCKADNSHRVAEAGDIYTLQIAAWLWETHTSATQPALIAETRVMTGKRTA
jgi:hypothetical protein